MREGRNLALLGGLWAVAGFAATWGEIGPERVRALAAGGALLFAPGYAWIRTSRRPAWGEGIFAAALAFPLSAAILVLLLLAGELAGAGTTILSWSIRPLLLAAGLLLLKEAFARRSRFRFPAWLLLLAVACGSLAFARGAFVSLSSDSLDHIAVLREIQEVGEPFPRTAYYAESTDLALDARKGFLHPALAVAGLRVDAGALAVYDAIPALLAFLFTLSFFALARETLAPAAAILALLYALLSHDGGPLGVWFGRSGAGFTLAIPILWTALLLFVRSARGAPSSPLLPLLVGFALVGAHLFAAVAAALLGGLFWIGGLLLRRREANHRSLLSSLLLVGAGTLPIGLWKLATSFPAHDPIHTHLQSVLLLGGPFYVISPQIVASRLSLFALLAFPLSLFLLRRAGRSAGVLFAVSTTLFPLFLLFNPLVVPLLVPIVGYLLGRIAWCGGPFLLLGCIVADAAVLLHRRAASLPKRAGALALLLLLHGTLATSIWARDAVDFRSRILVRPERRSEQTGPERWEDLFAFMNRELPPRAVVAADPITGYMIPAMTPQKTIAIRAQHSSPADPEAPRRLGDMVRALSPYVSGSETAAILEGYGARYLLLNFRFEKRTASYMTTIEPDLYEPTLEKFRREPARYHEIFARDRCHLFRIDGEGAPPAESDPVLAAALDALPGEVPPFDYTFPNGLRLAGLTAAPEVVAPGGRLRVACYWKKVGESPDPLPYKTYLRLDRSAEDPPIWAKAARKWEEVRTGRRLRARTMRSPGGMGRPPSTWPEGAVVADTILWELPSDLKEGSYELQVLLRRAPHLQVYTIDDLLRERDSFTGKPVGRITVRRREGA